MAKISKKKLKKLKKAAKELARCDRACKQVNKEADKQFERAMRHLCKEAAHDDYSMKRGDAIDIDKFNMETIRKVDCTVNALGLTDKGMNLIEYISDLTGKMLVINFRARDLLNSVFEIRIVTDGIHGVNLRVSSPSCFNTEAIFNMIKPCDDNCDSRLTAAGPIYNVLYNIVSNNIVASGVPDGKLTLTNNSGTVEEVNLANINFPTLILSMMWSILRLNPASIVNLGDAELRGDCHDCVNEHVDLGKVTFTPNNPHIGSDENVRIRPKMLPWCVNATVEFVMASDIEDFDYDVYTSKCEGCNFEGFFETNEDDDCDNDCVRCTHLYACDKDLPEHEESDEVAPDEDDDKLLTKVDPNENIVNNLKNGDLVVFGAYDAGDNCKVQVGRVTLNIPDDIQISVSSDNFIFTVFTNNDSLKKTIGTVLKPETTVITPDTIISMKDGIYYTKFINDDTAEDGTIWKNVICNFIHGGYKLDSRYAIMNDILEYASTKVGFPITEACVLNTDVPAEFIDGKISVNIIDIQKTDINE